MSKQRVLESAEDRSQRLVREARLKREEQLADEAAVDRMIKQNIAQYGP